MKNVRILVFGLIVLIVCTIVAVVLIGKNGTKIDKTLSAVIWNTDDDSGTYSAVTVKINMTYRNKMYSGNISVYSYESNDILYEYNNLVLSANSYGNMEIIEHSTQSNVASFIMYDKTFQTSPYSH